jgi:hypothetical protein
VKEASRANVELGIVLPLGVIANQLMKIEADLRFLNIKALGHTVGDGHGALAGQIAGRLEQISETLDLIRDLVADLQADIHVRKPLPQRDD